MPSRKKDCSVQIDVHKKSVFSDSFGELHKLETKLLNGWAGHISSEMAGKYHQEKNRLIRSCCTSPLCVCCRRIELAEYPPKHIIEREVRIADDNARTA